MPLYIYTPGDRQLVYGDRRGFKTPEEAALAAMETTYRAEYERGADMDKERKKDTPRYNKYLDKESRLHLSNGICPAYRADKPYFNASRTKITQFGRCGCLVDIDEKGHLSCAECLFETDEGMEERERFALRKLKWQLFAYGLTESVEE